MTTLVLGLSTRALAESALQSGNKIFTLDYFGDQDQKDRVENISLARDYKQPFSAKNLLAASRDLDFDSVVYTSNLENHPAVVETLSQRANVLGNSSRVLSRVRDWKILRDVCEKHSIAHPLTLLPGEEQKAGSKLSWLCKPTDGGGGTGIHSWTGAPIKPGFVLQEKIDGIPASAAFVADGKKGVVLGLTHQLIGQDELGGKGFSWCGNILPLPLSSDQQLFIHKAVETMVNCLVKQFYLRGVGGIDFVISRDQDNRLTPFLIEVNPRYTGAMELIEKAHGLNIYSLHLNGMKGDLPDFCLSYSPIGSFHAKGILFSPEPIKIRNTKGWSEKGRCDIPFPGDRIEQGHPVSSLFAKGKTHDQALTNLFKSADNLRQEICYI
jgi:predicted ATP-grasp superfamily ATP-dependent carboligase